MRTVVLFTALLLNIAFAQRMREMELIGKGELLQYEIIAKNNLDANGIICAGLVILSDLDGLSYKSYNGIIKIDASPGKDLLYISSDERVLEIYKTGFTPLKIILNDFGIKLKSGEVWQIKITGDKTNDIIPVNIIADPSGCEIFIDNEFKGTQPTQLITKGKHFLKIQKQGYKTIFDSCLVSNTNNLFTFHLEKIKLVAVTIKSMPQKAKIFFNNSEKGETDDQFFEFPGKYNLKLVLTGYNELQREIEISEASTNEFSFSMIKNTSSIRLSVIPSDANVLINKKDYSNLNQIELTPGRYQIEISKEGYYPKDDFIEIELNKFMEKTYTLDQMKGSLQIKVKPIEANVVLKKGDSVINSWRGARVINNLPTGEYTLSVTLTGYYSINKLVTINENGTTVEDFEMTTNEFMVENELTKDNQIREPEIVSDLNRTGALMKSILIPGLGQITNGRSFGWVYTATAVGGGLFYLLSAKKHNDNISNYNDLNSRYQNDITEVNKTATRNAYTETLNSYDQVTLALGVLTVVYVANLVDVLIFSPDNNEKTLTNNIQPAVLNNNGEFSFGINLRVGL